MSRTLVALAATTLVATVACERSDAPPSTPSSTEVPGGSAPALPQAEPAAEPEDGGGLEAEAGGAPPASSGPEAGRITEALGAETVGILRSPRRVTVARLRREAALRAEETSLAGPDRIAGYPLAGAPREISAEEARALGALLARDDSYLFDIARRCANRSWEGARFEGEGGEVVEVALGSPCSQAIFAFRGGGGVQRWGSVVSEEAARAFADLVSE